MTTKDYYSILQIKPTASEDEIRSAYKRLALQYHPDRWKHPGADDLMKLFNEAYTVLRDPEKRAQYDHERYIQLHPPPPPPPQPVVPVHVPTQPVRPERAQASNLAEEKARMQNEVLNRLLMLFAILVLTGVLFLVSLFVEWVNLLILLPLVLLALQLIFSIILRVQRFSRLNRRR